jgi:hypothetical protein
MTYAEHLQRNREHRRQAFDRLTDAERAVACEARMKWLLDHLWYPDAFHVQACPDCKGEPLVAHVWPSLHCCVCGSATILDVWMPDGRERSISILNLTVTGDK